MPAYVPCHRCRTPVPPKDAHRRGTSRFCCEQCADTHLEEIAANRRKAAKRRKKRNAQPIVLTLPPQLPEPVGPPQGDWRTWPIGWRVWAIQTHGAGILGSE